MSSPPPIPYHRCLGCGALLPAGIMEDLCPLCVGDETVFAEPGGRVLGDCELFEEIGRGGMGVVWRGRQRGLDRAVAVKTLPGGDLAGAEARARFRTEARATARLKHPNIVSIFDVGEADGMPYFVMELIEGRTLSATLADKPVPARQAAQWLRDAALAVQHAHDHGVLHRDLKPSNILIEPGAGGGRPRVTDFGLAKMTDSGAGMTLSGNAAGSPSFMPPEQARGGPATVAGDVYGLGAVLYHALTGRPPFQGESIAAVLAQVERDEPLSPRRLSSTVPRDLETISLKCLEKNPARRYVSALELADDLTRYLDGRPVLARPLGRLPRLLRLARRRPWQAAAAGLIAALVASGMLFLAWKAHAERQHQMALQEEQAATKLALMKSQLGEARSLVRLRQPDSRPRALAMAGALTDPGFPASIRGEARDVALAALALPAARTEPLTGQGTVSDDWTMTAADLPRQRWALSAFQGPVMIRPLAAAENAFTFPISPRKVTAMIGFSPGGRWLAIRHADELGIWHTAPEAANRLVFAARPWKNAPFNFMKTAFAPDDRAVVWADHDAVVVTALPDGKETMRWRGEHGAALAVNAVAFDPAGACVALALAGEAAVELREWPEGTVRLRITGLPREATALALTRRGERVAAGDAEGYVRIWQPGREGSGRLDLQSHTEPLRGLVFDAEGRLLFSTSEDGTMRAWDSGTGQEVTRLPFDMGLPGLSGDGLLLGVGYAGGQLSLARIMPSEMLHRFRPGGRPEHLQQISFSPDSRSLYGLTGSGGVRCAIPGGPELEAIPFDQPSSILATAGEGHALWISGASGLAWRPPVSPASPGRAPDPRPARWIFPAARWGWNALCATPDGHWVAASDAAGERAAVLDARQPDAATARFLRTPGLGTGTLALAPDGNRLAVAFRYDPGLQIFAVESGQVLKQLDLPPRHQLAWSPDGRWLAANGTRAVLWDTLTWQTASLEGLTGNHPPNGGAALSPVKGGETSRLLAMVTGNHKIALIGLPECRLLATLEAPDSRPLYQLQFSPDGRWLAAAAAGGEIQCWDLGLALKTAAGFTP